ncbi:ATP-binding protein, partial [Rhodococcus jostii]|uniref:ATP-binding protein n=1 Tax=Rhodococcus jostii TaxID=132919 RepID=UPI00363BDE58
MSTAPPSAPPLPADLESLLHRLRLPHIRRAAPDVLATARAQRWEPAEVLKALLAEEAAGRERSALATRRATAAFPTGKTSDAWKPELASIPAPTQQALRTLEWIERRENLVVCGPSGTGKTFFLETLGQHAVERGRKGTKGVAVHPRRPRRRPGRARARADEALAARIREIHDDFDGTY